jgi:hypothetical protein
MGWKIINGRSYYYSCDRLRGRVVTTYRGAGEFAALVAEIETHEARKRARAREEAEATYQAERTKAREADAEIGRLDAMLSRLADLEMQESGYHRIKRGPWRRRREMGETTLAKHRADSAEALDPADVSRRSHAGDREACKRFNEILNRANAGDAEALGQYRAMHRADPESFNQFVQGIVLATRDDLVVALFSAESHTQKVALDEYLIRMARDLAGPSPSPIERILADRVTLCWLDAYRCDHGAIHNPYQSVKMTNLLIHRQDRAHRRLLSAIKTLAEIRNLPLFRLQVSIQPPPSLTRSQTALEA